MSSARAIRRSSLPIRLLMEAKGTVVAVETVTGDAYLGTCSDIQETLNMRLTSVTLQRRGKSFTLDQVFIRGASIRFVAVHDGLRVRYEEELKAVIEKAKQIERRNDRERVPRAPKA
eukprot:TRINITY_DN8424_c0_g1_i1.p3 TRINITY_DN8424_c0_g1~~TRINITY_DN8424_c0_g1_i1.p3  ORF type:complete len:117 (+),score=42.86 TRINITY_DN8424_c0_g1_i1:467-817(+)